MINIFADKLLTAKTYFLAHKKESFFLFALFILIVSYFWFHIVFIIPIAFILPLLFVVRGIFYKKILRIEISYLRVILLFAVACIAILNLYGYHVTTFVFKKDYNISEVLLLNANFLKNIAIYILLLATYLLTFLLIGSKLLSIFFKDLKKITSKSGYYFLSLILGISVTGTIFFTFAIYGLLKPSLLFALFLFSIVINHKKLISILKKFISFKNSKLSFNGSVYKLMFWVALFIFVSSMFVVLFRVFVIGPDGLRLYLNLVKYIGENLSVPTTQANVLMPFFTEALFAPAYALGNIPLVISITYSVSALYVLGFFLIIKEEISKNYNWIIFTIIAFPPFLQIFAGEFKTDIFAGLISSSVFYSLYLLIKTREIKFFYLVGIFSVIAFLVKPTASFYILPTVLTVLGYIFYFNKNNLVTAFKHFVLVGLVSSIFIAPWILLYRIKLPEIGTFGLGLSETAKILPIENLHPCINEIQSYEHDAYFKGFDGSVKSYLKLPWQYFTGRHTKVSNFSLLDPGIFLPIFLLSFLYIVLTKSGKFFTKGVSALLMVNIFAVVIWLSYAPGYLWYASPSILCLILIGYVFISNSHSHFIKSVIFKATLFLASIYFVSLGLLHAIGGYFPPNLQPEDLKNHFASEDSTNKVYSDAQIIGDLVNENGADSAILFSSSAPFANIYFFIDKFFDRALFFDNLSKTMDENSLIEVIKNQNIKYLIFNNITLESGPECLKELQKNTKSLFEKNAEMVKETDSFTLYKIAD